MSRIELGGIVGLKLRDARREKGFSLRELGNLADVSPSLLSQIENGKTNPSVVTLYSIATVLEIPVSDFFPQITPGVSKVDGGNGAGEFSQSMSSETPASIDLHKPVSASQQYTVLQNNNVIVQSKKRVSIELMGGVIWERLTATVQKHIEILEIHYQPQATSGAVMSRHDGQEFGMVLEGELFLELGFDHYTLHQGDTVIFDSMTPHRLTNRQSMVMRAVWVIFNFPQK